LLLFAGIGRSVDEIETLGGEQVLVTEAGSDATLLAISDRTFGRIATIRLDAFQAAALISALERSAADAPR
jgi:hypothetical protein